MKQILVMRHAKSSWKDGSLVDHDRPLNGRGQRNAPQMGQWLADHNLVPELILSSTARRAHDTATLLVDGTGQPVPLNTDRSLYHADVEDFCGAVANGATDESVIMVVSHNPGVEHWVYSMTGEFETMPTAAVAVIQISGKLPWSQLDSETRGVLTEIWRPREIFV